MSSLTAEQRKRMEENRLKALERRAASQKQPTSSFYKKQQTFNIPKSNNAAEDVNRRSNSSVIALSSNNSNPFKQSGFKSKSYNSSPASKSNISSIPTPAPFTGRKINGSCRLLSQERFMVDVPYNTQVIEIFKSIPSRLYDVKMQKWNFSLKDHDKLITALTPLRPGVCIGSLPTLVLKALRTAENYPSPSNICLMDLDPLLLEAFLPFQRDAVCFGISREGRVLIADDMGLGKTIQALGIAAYYRNEWPLLIITPSSVRYSWAESVNRWIGSVTPDDVSVINSSKDNLGGDIIIMTYDLLSRRAKEVQDRNFKVVIMDESHMLKSFKAARYKAANPVMKKTNRLILLSGTPALSRPSELYTQISGVDKRLFPNFQEYGIRYCGAIQQNWGWDYSGSSNMEELQIILSTTIMIRRLKPDVIGQLPPKQRMTVLLDPSTIKSKTKAMEEASNHFNAIKGSERHGAMLQYFQQTAVAKVEAVCDYIKDLLEDGRKFLAYAHHRIVLDELCKICTKMKIRFIRIDGSTPSEARQKQVDDFQSSPDIKVAVLSITAANTGITLTAAQLVVFAELFWNPGLLVQAEDRVHRIGQVDSVLIQYLVAKETADDYIWPLIQSKLDVLNKAGLSNSNFNASISTNHKLKDDGITKYLAPKPEEGIEKYFKPIETNESKDSFDFPDDSLEDYFIEDFGESLPKKQKLTRNDEAFSEI